MWNIYNEKENQEFADSLLKEQKEMRERKLAKAKIKAEAEAKKKEEIKKEVKEFSVKFDEEGQDDL